MSCDFLSITSERFDWLKLTFSIDFQISLQYGAHKVIPRQKSMGFVQTEGSSRGHSPPSQQCQTSGDGSIFVPNRIAQTATGIPGDFFVEKGQGPERFREQEEPTRRRRFQWHGQKQTRSTRWVRVAVSQGCGQGQRSIADTCDVPAGGGSVSETQQVRLHPDWSAAGTEGFGNQGNREGSEAGHVSDRDFNHRTGQSPGRVLGCYLVTSKLPDTVSWAYGHLQTDWTIIGL